MADDVPKTLQEILDLTGDTQTKLGKKLGVGQSTVNRWLAGENTPNKKQWDRIQALWMKLKGIRVVEVQTDRPSFDLNAKIAPYDDDTKRIVNDIVDDYLRRIPPPHEK